MIIGILGFGTLLFLLVINIIGHSASAVDSMFSGAGNSIRNLGKDEPFPIKYDTWVDTLEILQVHSQKFRNTHEIHHLRCICGLTWEIADAKRRKHNSWLFRDFSLRKRFGKNALTNVDHAIETLQSYGATSMNTQLKHFKN